MNGSKLNHTDFLWKSRIPFLACLKHKLHAMFGVNVCKSLNFCHFSRLATEFPKTLLIRSQLTVVWYSWGTGVRETNDLVLSLDRKFRTFDLSTWPWVAFSASMFIQNTVFVQNKIPLLTNKTPFDFLKIMFLIEIWLVTRCKTEFMIEPVCT